MKEKLFLLITGMHRSGTSFLARALNLSGVYLGKLEDIVSNDWIPSKDNLRGHWENEQFVQLAEKTLAFSKGSWKDIPKNIMINDEIGQEVKTSVKELTEPPLLMAGFKDSRILLCLNAWKKFLPNNILIIGIFRHPLKVAESLKKRDMFSYKQSLELWKTYNQNMLNFLEKYDGFLLNFDWPKERLFEELNMISKKLGLFENADLSEWYTEKLITSHKTMDRDYTIPTDVQTVYLKLQKYSESNSDVNISKKNFAREDKDSIINGLYAEIQNQGNYFKKINDENLTRIKLLEEKLESEVHSLTESINKKRAGNE